MPVLQLATMCLCAETCCAVMHTPKSRVCRTGLEKYEAVKETSGWAGVAVWAAILWNRGCSVYIAFVVLDICNDFLDWHRISQQTSF